MGSVGVPALVPNATGAQHDIELGLAMARGAGVIKCLPECHALDGRLGVAVDDLWRGDAQAVIERRDDVDGVDILVTDLATRPDALGPRDDEGVRDATFIRGPTLPHLVGRVKRHRPAERVMIVGLLRAQDVEVLDVLLDRVRRSIEELVLVDRAIGTVGAHKTLLTHLPHYGNIQKLVESAEKAGAAGC